MTYQMETLSLVIARKSKNKQQYFLQYFGAQDKKK